MLIKEVLSRCSMNENGKYTFAISCDSNIPPPPRSTEARVTGPLCRHRDRPESQDDTTHAIPAARSDPPQCNSGRTAEWRDGGVEYIVRVIGANNVGHYQPAADCAALPRQENALCHGLVSLSG